MSKIYIIANWKMNPAHPQEAKKLLQKIKKKTKAYLSNQKLEVVICPPAPWLALFDNIESPILFGGQSGFYEDKGAFTGQISVAMLKNIGAKYLLVGHSESRKINKLSNTEIRKKFNSAFNNKITPIYFVGEREKQNREETLKKQLDPLAEIKNKKYLLVYEPLWAISKHRNSRPARPKEVESALQFIKKTLKKDLQLNELPPFLYGGSTNENNIRKFFSLEPVSGVVPGSASIKPESFAEMIKTASQY